MKKKPTHGGSREGAGRPAKEPSKVIRVPLGILERVLQVIKTYKTKNHERR